MRTAIINIVSGSHLVVVLSIEIVFISCCMSRLWVPNSKNEQSMPFVPRQLKYYSLAWVVLLDGTNTRHFLGHLLLDVNAHEAMNLAW